MKLDFTSSSSSLLAHYTQCLISQSSRMLLYGGWGMKIDDAPFDDLSLLCAVLAQYSVSMHQIVAVWNLWG